MSSNLIAQLFTALFVVIICLSLTVHSLPIPVITRQRASEIWKTFKGPPNPRRAISTNNSTTLSPLILLGGFGGSALNAQRTNAKEPHFWCESTTSEPFQVWANLNELIPHVTEECTVHDLTLDLRGQPRKLHPLDAGVSITGKDVGGLSGVNYITNYEFINQAVYMELLTSYLIKHGGYIGGKTLRAMTYDWRTGPIEWKSKRMNNTGGDYDILQKLVEDTYYLNNGTQVSLLGHSLGAPFTQLFLATHVSKEWKQKFIKQFISVSGSYDGEIQSPILHMTGDTYGLFFLSREQFKKMVRTFGSPSYMYPLKTPFTNYPMFQYTNNQTNQKANYFATVESYGQFMKDASMTNGWELFMQESQSILDIKFAAPGVPTQCIYGSNNWTPTQYSYTGPKRMEELTSADIQASRWERGDDTLPDYCLEMCSQFKQEEKIETTVLPGAHHIGIMMEERFFIKLLEIL
ncbi:predicted protein [Naegleria gruberi]|uniref:Predicted protein n=1 Tax=Naegleria gruberi TaxID=5762 RepID=D2VGF2_NAEGR|nr:uncharacterized protein NAEGRDRAFT_67955 [Naegleria gruberi]EFC44051.1 predicted protein [Naegleria gruberi]|eukprot:XP_002676795.1 predicted protein [Naegleria gruberi strain NEG-M]